MERLQWACGAQELDFHCTDDLLPLEGFVGQNQAIKAIEFALGLNRPGYNLFVTGMSGTGKASAIKQYVQRSVDERLARSEGFSLYDWCYLHNFIDPDRPIALQLPPNRGREFRRQMQELLEAVRDVVPATFSGESYTGQRKQLEERGRSRHQEAIRQLESQATAAGFAVEFGPNGVNLFPVRQRPAHVRTRISCLG